MSNRRKPQRLSFASSTDALRAVLAYKCPDCNSELGPVMHTPGARLTRAQIRHDVTCPWLRAYEGDQ